MSYIIILLNPNILGILYATLGAVFSATLLSSSRRWIILIIGICLAKLAKLVMASTWYGALMQFFLCSVAVSWRAMATPWHKQPLASRVILSLELILYDTNLTWRQEDLDPNLKAYPLNP